MEHLLLIARFLVKVVCAFIMVGIIEGAKDDYMRKYPGQPGWGMYLFGYGALIGLTLL